MVSLAKELDGKPFHWVSSHSRWPDGPNKQEAIDFVDKLTDGLENFSMIAGTKHPDIKQKGIPFFAVFDHHGNLVDQFKGHPSDLETRLKALVDAVPGLYLGRLDYTVESVRELARQAESSVPPGRVLKEIQSLLEDPDQAKAHPEATDLQQRLLDYGENATAKIRTRLGVHPDRALGELKALADDFKGSPFGDTLKELHATTKSDKVFRANRKAIRKFNQLCKEMERLKPCRSCADKSLDPSCSTCRQEQSDGVKSLIKKLEKLERTGPELPVMERVRKLIAQLTLTN